MTVSSHVLALVSALVFGALSWSAVAQEDLAKESQNPLGDLISFTSENKTSFSVGPEAAVVNRNDLKLVYPVHLGEWILVNRPIFPVIYQGERVEGEGTKMGWGDLNYQGFFTPAAPGKILWGVGPSLFIPTHSDDRLGSDKWSGGPAAVVLAKPGPWLFGSLVQNIWSFAGDSDAPDINLFSLQYFINYNLGDGWYLTSTPTITADWEADGDDRWTVPFGGGVGRLIRIGEQPIDLRGQGQWNAVAPDGAASWTLQLQVKLLFPK